MNEYYKTNDINNPIPIFDDIESLKKIFKDYILHLLSRIPALLLVNDLQFSFLYILFLLTDEPKIFTAIQQIHKLKNPHELSFYHCYYVDHFLEIIMNMNTLCFNLIHIKYNVSSNLAEILFILCTILAYIVQSIIGSCTGDGDL